MPLGGLGRKAQSEAEPDRWFRHPGVAVDEFVHQTSQLHPGVAAGGQRDPVRVQVGGALGDE
jgi:hypothetical protein